MGRKKCDDSKQAEIKFRETPERKKRLDEYARLNRMSVADYIREALDIRDEMTRQKFNLRLSEDFYDEVFEPFDEYDDNDFEE